MAYTRQLSHSQIRQNLNRKLKLRVRIAPCTTQRNCICTVLQVRGVLIFRKYRPSETVDSAFKSFARQRAPVCRDVNIISSYNITSRSRVQATMYRNAEPFSSLPGSLLNVSFRAGKYHERACHRLLHFAPRASTFSRSFTRKRITATRERSLLAPRSCNRIGLRYLFINKYLTC